MKRRLLLPALGIPGLAALTFGIAACGGGTTAPPPTVPAGAVEVDAGPGLKLGMSEYTATAQAGVVTIAYVNKDSQRHTLVVVNADKIVEGTKLVVAGRNDVAVGKFNLAPGKYMIYCDVPGHSSAMKASLVVS
jgi:plastocyanin